MDIGGGPAILIVHTREICYYSGAFFLHRAEEALEGAGARVDFLDLSAEDSDWEELRPLLSHTYDAILDINSKLPYLVLDDGARFLDRAGIPFYNWIVDHPLYHHPGLVIPIRDHHVLTIDRSQAAYVREEYPHIRSASYLPLPGTRAGGDGPAWRERGTRVLLTGTMISGERIRREEETVLAALGVDERAGKAFRALYQDLDQGWGRSPFSSPLETAVKEILSREGTEPGDYAAGSFGELMNHLYPLDRKVRYRERMRMARAAAEALWEAGDRLTIRGEGWKDTDFSVPVRILPPVPISVSYDLIREAKVLLDINPLFYEGVHDRVPSALINGTLVLTCMSERADPSLTEEEGVFYFHGEEDLKKQVRMLLSLGDGEGDALSEKAIGKAQKDLSWEAFARDFLTLAQAERTDGKLT